jgi:Effector-associated domain 1
MSLFNEPFDLGDQRVRELLGLACTGYSSKDQIGVFVTGIGIARSDIDWDGALADVWPRILTVAARRARLRQLVKALLEDENYAQVRPRIEALFAAAEEEERDEAKSKAGAADHTRVTVVGRRPFVNRSRFRDNVKSLFGADGDHSMIVDGPRKSGRSYSWVLISYVTRMTGGLQTSLIDVSRFRGVQAKPDDVAKMIAADLNWPPPKEDPTAQDDTRGRVLLGWVKSCVRGQGAVCLVFDGLDGDNLMDATVSFIGDIAAAAGNDELGDSRVVLLAFGRALQNPNVDPFVLREPPLADIPLAEFIGYLRTVAAEGGQDMSEGQAKQLAERLFGLPQPDPVPVSLLAARADEVSRIVCKLRRGSYG